MKLPRRQFLRLAAGAAALPAVSRIARAQAYPSRPVRIIVGLAAGGGPDIVARLIGQWLSERLGQSFVIENRPGAAGNVATEAVVNASADGHTLLAVSPGAAIASGSDVSAAAAPSHEPKSERRTSAVFPGIVMGLRLPVVARSESGEAVQNRVHCRLSGRLRQGDHQEAYHRARELL